MTGTTRRRQFVAKPSFQIKLTIIFMLMVTIVANLVGFLCFALISSDLEPKLARLTDPGTTVSGIAQALIPQVLLAEAATLILVFFLCIWVTHTIAGPLYRMERVAREIGEGDLSLHLQLRPHDELRELADALNAMSRGLARRLYRIREALDEMEAEGAAHPGLKKLDLAIAEFRLPPRRFLGLPPSPTGDEAGAKEVTNVTAETFPEESASPDSAEIDEGPSPGEEAGAREAALLGKPLPVPEAARPSGRFGAPADGSATGSAASLAPAAGSEAGEGAGEPPRDARPPRRDGHRDSRDGREGRDDPRRRRRRRPMRDDDRGPRDSDDRGRDRYADRGPRPERDRGPGPDRERDRGPSRDRGPDRHADRGPDRHADRGPDRDRPPRDDYDRDHDRPPSREREPLRDEDHGAGRDGEPGARRYKHGPTRSRNPRGGGGGGRRGPPRGGGRE